MHPATITVLQEQQGARRHSQHQEPLIAVVDVDSDNNSKEEEARGSFPQRFWRFVRESVLARPRRKVRSASYSPESEGYGERPRQSKKRAKSCGHEAEGRRAAAAKSKENRTAFVTANAWRKSKMLQELEASTERGQTSCMPSTAVLRDKQSHKSQTASEQHLPTRRHHSAAQGRCRNCDQVFFAPTTEPQQRSPQFCSLDCKSTFQYLQQMQHFVNERIDEEDGSNNSDEHETPVL
ncbi:hypothetical protein Gpo141_00005148 [Globisporangium polare]